MIGLLKPFVEKVTKIEEELTRIDLTEPGRLTTFLALLAPIDLQANIIHIVMKGGDPKELHLEDMQFHPQDLFFPTKQDISENFEIVIDFLHRVTLLNSKFFDARAVTGDTLFTTAFELFRQGTALVPTKQPTPMVFSLEAPKPSSAKKAEKEKAADKEDYEGISFMRGAKKGFLNQ